MKIFSDDSTISAIYTNTFVSFFAKLLIYMNFALIAYIFGAQRSTDIYYLGISFVTLCSGLFTVIFMNVFSPILIRVRIKNTIEEAKKFAGSTFSYVTLLLILFCAILLVFATQIFSAISKFPIDSINEHKLMFTLFSVVILFTVISEFGKVYIQSMGHYSIVAYITVIQSLAFILLILALAGIFKILILVLALIISLVIQLYLLYSFCKRNRILPRLNISYNALHLELFKTSTPLVMAHTITLSVAYCLDYIASGLETGTLTSLTFASRLYVLPMFLLFNPMLEVVNTKFAEYYHTNKELLVDKFIQLQRFFIMLLTPIMIIFIFFRLEIVKLFFLRGEFGYKEAVITADSLGIFSLTIVSFCLLAIISRVYFVMQKTGWSSFFGAINQLVTIFAAFFLSKTLGYIAIPIAKVSSELLFMIPVSFWLVNKYLPHNPLKRIFLPFVGLFFLAGTLGYLLFALFIPLNKFIYSLYSNEKFSEILGLLILITIYAMSYIVILLKINFAEMKYFIQKVKSFGIGFIRASV